MISDKARRLSSSEKIARDRKIWKDSEELFYDLFPKLTHASKVDNINHIDFEFDEFVKVDLKGLKTMHKKGFVLIEFINVAGKHGWCHSKSKAKFFAFQFVNEFIIVSKDDLIEYLRSQMPEYSPEVVQRKNGLKDYKNLCYTYVGRENRKDVFTYIPKEDLLKVPHINYPY